MGQDNAYEQLRGVPVDQIEDLVDITLWGFNSPSYWLAQHDVRQIAATLFSRPDAHDKRIRDAIANCIDYLRSGFGA